MESRIQVDDKRKLEWAPDKISRFWSYHTLASDQSYFSEHSGRNILRHIRRRVSLGGKLVLDYGCGSGSMLRHLLSERIRCGGLEFAEGSARAVNERLSADPLFEGVTLAESLPSTLQEGSYDVVFCVEVVEHLTDDVLRATLEEIHRILRSGGHVALTTPNEEDLESAMVMCPECGSVFHRYQHVRRWTTANLSSTMENAGFDTLSCRALHFARGDTLFMRLATRVFSQATGRRPHMLYVGRKR